MPAGGSNDFIQGYNCQTAVDEKAQVIVASNVTREPNDKKQVKPVLAKLEGNTGGKKPTRLSADSGYFSEANCKSLEDSSIDAFIATEKGKHSEVPPTRPRGRIPKNTTLKERMARKLRTIKGRCTYSKRKQIVEPVFGQIKEVRGFRRFSFRGFDNCRAEWDLVCLTHNLLKLFRSGWIPEPA